MFSMTPDQEEHLEFIQDEFADLVEDKYRKGQKEHGGNLWEKEGLLDMAIDEAIDQVVYLLTLKQQFEEAQTDDDSSSRPQPPDGRRFLQG